MALRVPAIEMQHEALAVRLRRVIVRILHVGRTKQLLAPPPLAKLVGVIDGVARLVPKDLHAPGLVAPFDFEHLRSLQFLQAWMREVEGDRDAGNAVWGKPFGRQPEVRLKGESPRIDLALQLGDACFKNASFDGHAEL